MSLTPREKLFRTADPEDDTAFGRAVDDYRRALLEAMADDIAQTLSLAAALGEADGPEYRRGFAEAGRLAAEYLRSVARGTMPLPEPEVCLCGHPASTHNINQLCTAVPGARGCGCLGWRLA
jgi:hypothetical protein